MPYQADLKDHPFGITFAVLAESAAIAGGPALLTQHFFSCITDALKQANCAMRGVLQPNGGAVGWHVVGLDNDELTLTLELVDHPPDRFEWRIRFATTPPYAALAPAQRELAAEIHTAVCVCIMQQQHIEAVDVTMPS